MLYMNLEYSNMKVGDNVKDEKLHIFVDDTDHVDVFPLPPMTESEKKIIEDFKKNINKYKKTNN